MKPKRMAETLLIDTTAGADTDEEPLKNAPGFDTDNWPNMGYAAWENSVHSCSGAMYWS